MKITVVFNNFNMNEGLVSAWGMGAVVDMGKEKLLFDTGSDGGVLLENMKRLGISALEISRVVISHNHWDHTGGLLDFINVNPNVSIYAPDLDDAIVSRVRMAGSEIHFTSDPVPITTGISTTGVFSHPVPEQAVVLETSSGYVTLTGCSHPGVVSLVLATPEPRYLVTGGFHLFRSSPEVIRQTALSLQETGVEFIAPSHCTGGAAMEYFRDLFGNRCVYGGLGAVFDV